MLRKSIKTCFGVAAIALSLVVGIANAKPLIKASLYASPKTTIGKCPKTIKFIGKVSSSHRVVLKYRFIRSDGAKSQFKKLVFLRPGTKAVSTTWTIGKSYAGWQAIEIVRPYRVLSNRAVFKLRCIKRPIMKSKITLVRPYRVCVKKGQKLYIVGKNFGNYQGPRGVAMGGHGKHVDLKVLKWSNTMIIARIPFFAPLQNGKSYYVAVEKKNHSQWLSNLYQPIKICKSRFMKAR